MIGVGNEAKLLNKVRAHLREHSRYLLVLALCIAPFLSFRLIRTAGDEKLYVYQAVEMAERGDWIIQWVKGGHEYFKGPFHYLLLRLGMLVFGKSAWAVYYMNLMLIAAGGLALASLARRRLARFEGASDFVAVWLALAAGVYSHVFASQMEVELVSFFTIGLWLLDRTARGSNAWGFWVLAGLLGWIKSPLHSVFLGVSAALLWGFRGELLERVKRPRSWLAVFSGILVCAGGYLPAYLIDRDAFVNTYVMRETMNKGGSGLGWTVPLSSTFGFYLFPFLVPALGAYIYGIFRARSLWRDREFRPLLLLAVALCIPSVVFFTLHTYRFENYNLPVIAAPILVLTALLGRLHHSHPSVLKSLFAANGAILLVLPIGLTTITVRMQSNLEWWPGWLMPLAWAGTLGTLFLVVRAGRGGKAYFRRLAVALIPFYIALGAALSVLGELELRDLKTYIRTEKPAELIYSDVHSNLFNEWGLLGFWVDAPIRFQNNLPKLKESLRTGGSVIVPFDPDSSDVKKVADGVCPHLEVRPWRRWRTRGQLPNGKTLWADAWNKRDVSPLYRMFSILRCRP